MMPRDYAVEIEPDASPERIHEIETVIRRALADELCRVAALVDEEDREEHIRFPCEAAQINRKEAQLHLNQT